VTWQGALYIYFNIAIVLDHAHLVSPVGLAWSNAAFRQVIFKRWRLHIASPVALLAGCIAMGLAFERHSLPMQALTAVWVLWDAWHFGSQHWGVACLLGWRSGPRRLRKATLIVPTMAVMLVPALYNPLWLLWVGLVISLVHWLTDIGLSSWKARRWYIFLIVALPAGLMGFIWKKAGIDSRVCGQLMVCAGMTGISVLFAVRVWLSFVHYLYSQSVWVRDSPVRRSAWQRQISNPMSRSSMIPIARHSPG